MLANKFFFFWRSEQTYHVQEGKVIEVIQATPSDDANEDCRSKARQWMIDHQSLTGIQGALRQMVDRSKWFILLTWAGLTTFSSHFAKSSAPSAIGKDEISARNEPATLEGLEPSTTAQGSMRRYQG